MELIVFDLDGTLLNRSGSISPYTRATLAQLSAKGVAYTVATGRTLHGARDLLTDAGFKHPQVFKNGVLIWHPIEEDYSHCQALTLPEIEHILRAVFDSGISPFVFTLSPDNEQGVFHPPLELEVEKSLAKEFARTRGMHMEPLSTLPADALITNISALGAPEPIDAVLKEVASEEHLVAYGGDAFEGQGLKWLDVHHTEGSKGAAVELLRQQLGASKVICFGDSDNDLSMFATADECYAPANAKAHVLEAADAVIGHHDEDGVARFLRERFNLPAD
ncbi:MAG: HAD family hydrolase [Pseudomonadota bacterium]